MRWSYKTVHYELKKEGLLGSAFLDAPEIELSLNEYGRAGWELVSMLETMDGIIAVFKQPLSDDSLHLFHIDSAKNDHKRVKERRPEIAEKETDPVLNEIFPQDEADDEKELGASVIDQFEVAEVDPEEEEPVEKQPRGSEGGAGAIRIE